MIVRIAAVGILSLLLGACGDSTPNGAAAPVHGETASAGEYERGPHRGRMLRDGDFAVEVTIFEAGVPPQYRLYAYQADKPLAPAAVDATIDLERLDGEVNHFTFKAESDYLVGSGTVTEPHSFDVKVDVRHAGRSHTWAYESYEGRTTIPKAIATEAGVEIDVAGPAVIKDTVSVMGRVALDTNRRAEVRARFPGIVRAVHVEQGERVRRGQALLVVEGNDSMRSYTVTAPIDGVVLVRMTNVGDVAGDNALIEIADLSKVWIELNAIGKDSGRIAAGQSVRIKSTTGDAQTDAVIDALLPLATQGQSVVARTSVDNADGRWRPGMIVSADVAVAERTAPITVKESGLQRFRDFTVVFAQVGETYEVRMLELGARDGERVEVLGGIKPGTPYVSEQSFLIKADIEKSGASHDH